jgi:YD repeat-containing protein
MKIKLLLAFIAFSFISCSDDDASPSQPEKNLDQMVIKKYNNGTYGQKVVYDFDDHNRVTLINRYDAQDEYFSKTTYEYDQMLLSVEKTYGFGMGDLNEPSSVISYNYDSSSRLISIDDHDAAGVEFSDTNIIFTYNADNTISAVETIVGPPSEDIINNYTYHKNADGNIVKKVDDGNTVLTQAVYDGANVLSYSRLGWPTWSYQYNVSDSPKGDYLKINTNKFDGSFNNTILAEDYPSVSNGVTNYISQHTISNTQVSDVTTYTYEFDDDGYPIKVSLFKQGSTQPYEVREISYQ